MKTSGIIGIVLGALLVIAGTGMNGDEKLIRQSFPNVAPGNGVLTIGVIILAVGIVLLALKYIKKKK